MTDQSLINLLDSIRNGVDPRNGEFFKKEDTRLGEPPVRRAFNRLIKELASNPEAIEVDVPDSVISTACEELRALGYQPCVTQLVKVFIGSRSIVDRNLKGLQSYNRYRGIYTRDLLHTHLIAYHRKHPNTLLEMPALGKATVHEPWRVVDFFREAPFDKLDDTKDLELRRAVQALGLRKADDRLPAYMATARLNYPRAFEPWVRDEQALLIEAMCYTNQIDKLVAIFGRSASSLEKAGQKLIYDSQQNRVA